MILGLGILFIGLANTSEASNYITALLISLFCISLSIWWLLVIPKIYRSRCIYLYSDGFVYSHGKEVDVFLWNQIREAEKAEQPLRYIIIRRDSKKIVLKDIFQSTEYLGDSIIREYKQLNRP